jgi:hypothetical protein
LTMRRAAIVVAVVGICAGAGVLPGEAAARPTVTLKATAMPVPTDPSKRHSATFPGTGAIFGAPFAGEIRLTIAGTEYGGSPSPLTGVKFYAPAGVKVRTQGFAVCTEATLLEKGAEGCPKRSFAGVRGEAEGVVTFGGTRVHETVSVQPFFGPGGSFLFYVVGNTPASIELISKGTLGDAAPPFGSVFTGEVPLVKTVPEALDASVEQIDIEVGAAFKAANKLVSFLTAPRTCPKGGFPVKVELSFLSGETVPAGYKFPCPKHR